MESKCLKLEKELNLDHAVIGYVSDDQGVGPVYDCAKLAETKTEGVSLKETEWKTLKVTTKNSLYIFEKAAGLTFGMVRKWDSLANLGECGITGSTWGGSMLKVGYIGLGMHLEFWSEIKGTLTTTAIQSIEVE